MIDLPNETFDIVILSNVLEHIKDRIAFLRNIERKINPEIILVRVPNFERDWRVPLKKVLDIDWRLDPTHETEYSLNSFTKEISEAGFNINHFEIRWGEIWCELKPDFLQPEKQ